MIYRKQGAVARWENGTLVRVTESGEARETGELFECWPVPVEQRASARRTVELPGGLNPAAPQVRAERLILTHGIAHHQYGDRTWTEETHRVHASLVHGKLRALFDGETGAGLHPIAEALKRVEPEREAPRHLRFAPNVTAALLPFVKLENVRLLQTAGGVDGYGNDIVEAAGEWPNWYRPSYRIRPVRVPHNLRIECDVTEVDETLPRAIALLAPVDGPALRVLVEDGPRVYPCTVRVTRVEGVSNERTWYPYGAGSFGAEMML